MAIEIGPGNSDQENRSSGFRRRESKMPAFAPGERPHDFNAEKAILAGMLLSSEALIEVQNAIQPIDFYLPAHQATFAAMMTLGMKNVPIDLTTLTNELREQGKLDLVGGVTYLSQIATTPSTSTHAIEYASIIKDLAWRRRILDAAENVKALAIAQGDTREVVAKIEKELFGATQERKTSNTSRISDLLVTAISELERRVDQKDVTPPGVLTGLRDLDDTLGGLRPGQLVVVAAGPGTGKTSIATNIMYHASSKQQKRVLFFSLEMTQIEVVERIIAQATSIDSGKLRSGNLQGRDFQEIYASADELNGSHLYIDDRSQITPYDILGQARKLNAELMMQGQGQLDLIVVDYIQIMKSGGNVENRSLEVAAITGGLKAIAKELKLPVMALSQINREGAKRQGTENKRPQLSDLRDSGAIEADADVVMFIHREQGPDTDSRAPAEAEIIVAKNRAGPTRAVKVTWLGALTRFSDYIDPGFVPPEFDQGFNPDSNSY